MKPYIIDGEVHLTCELGDDDIIYLTMGGNVSGDTIDYFLEWAEKVKEAMREAYKRNPGHVLTLIDTRAIHEIDMDSVGELSKLLKYNKQYATRTAVYGANYFVHIIVEMALHISGRKNLEIFETKEEALKWLLGNSKKTKKEKS
jgi:hypothetical protein